MHFVGRAGGAVCRALVVVGCCGELEEAVFVVFVVQCGLDWAPNLRREGFGQFECVIRERDRVSSAQKLSELATANPRAKVNCNGSNPWHECKPKPN
jgi:hypothetical protein